jgi:hypothetical protein
MTRWSRDKANRWYAQQPWLVGCNYIPSNAINGLEMFQGDSFDPEINERELGWAASLGFNVIRVYLHDLLWQADADGLRKTIDQFLGIAERHGIRALLVLFDDCHCDNPKLGEQPAPRPSIHNSGWVRSPGTKVLADPSQWSRLEAYACGVISAFEADARVLGWDLYNEPRNGKERKGDSLALLKAVFEWARQVGPRQPLTSGAFSNSEAIREFQLQESDVITFHNYGPEDGLKRDIEKYKALGRPVICTEYMARTRGSRFQTHLPIFKEEKVGCISWGLVSGKSQTVFPWGTTEGAPEPDVWFHDILRADGTAYDADEVACIRRLTQLARDEMAQPGRGADGS